MVIPAEVREKMAIKPGCKLVAMYVPGKDSVAFVSEDKVQYLIDKMGEHIAAVRSQLDKDKTKQGDS